VLAVSLVLTYWCCLQSVLAAVLGAIALLIFSGLVANLVVVQVG
jgi:hypothetical protein